MKHARIPSVPALLACSLALAAGGLSACGDGDGSAAPDAARPAASSQGTPKASASPSAKPGASSAVLAYEQALQHARNGELEPAETELRRALELDPKLAEAHFELARLLTQRSNRTETPDLALLEQGIAAFVEACELEPSNDRYRLQLGRAYLQKHDLEKAVASLEKALELNPKSAGAWKTLGQAQLEGAKAEAGRESLKRALELNPRDAGAQLSMAEALGALGDAAGARTACEQALKLDPGSREAYALLTRLCQTLGDAEGETQARTSLERLTEFDQRMQERLRAVEQNPADGLAQRRLGEIYFEIGEWEQARDSFLRAIRANTKDWQAHLWCGVARRHLKDYVYAMHHLKEAEFLAPDVLDPKLELVRLYAERKDEASLKEVVLRVESEASADGDTLWFMAQVCKEVGYAEDAKRLFEKAAALGVTAEPEAPATVEVEVEPGK